MDVNNRTESVATKLTRSIKNNIPILTGCAIATLLIFGAYQYTHVSKPILSDGEVVLPTPEESASSSLVSPDNEGVSGAEPENILVPDEFQADAEYPIFYVDARDYASYYTADAQSGVSWLPHPIKIAIEDSKIFTGALPRTYEYAYEYIRHEYYKLGTYNGADIVYTNLFPGDPSGNYPGVFLIDKTGDSYTFLPQYSTQIDTSYGNAPLFVPTVKYDTTLTLAELKKPDSFTYKNTRFILTENGLSGFFENEVPKLLTQTPYGPLFMRISQESSTLQGVTEPQSGYIEFALRRQSGVWYTATKQVPFMREDGVPEISFLDGTQNATSYRGVLGGCGRSIYPRIALVPIAERDLTLVGATPSGESVYNLTNPEHVLIRDTMSWTNGTYFTYDAQDGSMVEHSYTAEEFIKDKGMLVYTDSLGYQTILTNTKYGPQAECGKPVVYLYPTATTTISVQVGAEVTKSEPAYENSWVAEANPEGQLIVNGKKYPNLFWEGTGNGAYPLIRAGVVVKTGDALARMEQDLATMGFTAREIRDFNEFWSAHLPKQPYTRITWLMTREMNELAPLTITPRPDTLLRAFVDFEGLDAPIILPPQSLPHTERRGYVATEWGGLLRHTHEE